MATHYAGLSEPQCQAYLGTYLQLKSKYYRVMCPFFASFVGQGVLYATLFEAHVDRRVWPLGLVVSGVPWLIYFAITFVRVPPPIRPRTFGRLLLVVVSWYVASTVVLVSIGVAKLIPMTTPTTVTTAIWLSALVGGLGVPTLIHFQGIMRQQVNASAVGSHS